MGIGGSIAEELAKKQREISVSEFFERNKHILGFDSPTKALVTAVKEGVDNSVEHEEPVLVREGGIVHLVKIGEYIDRRIEHEGEAGEGEGRAFVHLNDCEVLAYDGSTFKVSWHRASMAHRHPLHGDLYEIELLGGRRVTVTGSHSVFGLKNNKIVALRVQSLKEGDYVVVPHRELAPQPCVTEIDLRPWLMSLPPEKARAVMIHGMARHLDDIPRDWKRFDFVPLTHVQERGLTIPTEARVNARFGESRIPVVIPISEALMRFLGLYAAEGTRFEKLITLSFGSHEVDLIERARKNVLEAFGPEVRVSVVPAHRTAVCVKIYCAILSDVLQGVFKCGDRAHSKRVPDIVFNVTPDLREAFLEGYTEGDGYRGRQKTILATVSEELAIGLVYLYSLKGKAYTVGRRPATSRKFPGGYVSPVRETFYLYIYDVGDMGYQPNAPLNWLPLKQTGFIDVVTAMDRMGFRGFRRHDDMFRRPHYTIRRFSAVLAEAGPYEEFGWPGDLYGQRVFLDRLVHGDVSLLQVTTIRKVESKHKFVYDFSVPGSEKFLGGRGAMFLHNTLDACADADILPDVVVEVKKVDGNEFRVMVEDNGPGIVKKEVANVFGRLLYGSRFHSNRVTRGQQGLGISGAVLYSQLTSGRPVTIRSKVQEKDVAYEVDLTIDTKRNMPHPHREEYVIWEGKDHGTRITMWMKGRYIFSRQSIYEYLKGTAIANPHARIEFNPPEGDPIVFPRATLELPPKTKEIPPHPRGVEIGTLIAMARETKANRMTSFLSTEFTRVTERTARELLDKASVNYTRRPRELSLDEAKRLMVAMEATRFMAPPLDCLSPIGEKLIRKALRNVLGSARPEFYCPPVTREPAVYSGNPFQVEVGIVYGGDLPPDQAVEVLRFANRVPLLYAAGSCATTQAVAEVDWRRYGLEQRGGKGVPYGPALILLHVTSTKVPFTSESKEAVAPVPEILEELQLALKEAGRRLRSHMAKKERRVKAREKFEIVQRILPKMAEKSAKVLGKERIPDISATITKIMDVVWIDEEIRYEKGVHTVTLNVYNYTPVARGFKLHALLPRATLAGASFSPGPEEVKADGKVTWELKKIPSTKQVTITMALGGMEKGEYDESELYVSGINPIHVIGAEPLPGDWDLEYVEPEATSAEEALEAEPDYDQEAEVLEDD